MNGKQVIKLLVPGVFVGIILGMALGNLIGVHKELEMVNFIGCGMSCAVPTFLNCLIVLKRTAKILYRDLSFGKALLKTIPYVLLAFVVGFSSLFIIVSKIMGINVCELTTMTLAIYETILGVIVSSISAFIALKRYEH